MIQYDNSTYFFLLLLLPVLLLLFLAQQYWKRRARKNFADPALLKRLAPDLSASKPWLKLTFFLLGLSFLILGLVNPKIGTRIETVKREGVDIVFAVDVSRSMLAEDIAPSRLEKAQRIVSELISELASDRIGIIAYAGQAYPQLPITTDYGAARMFLQALNTEMLSSQGTAIHEAIDLAVTYFDDTQQTNRVLFILSDGEDHAEASVQEAVSRAQEAGIRIFTIGIGTSKGGPIPLRNGGTIQEYKKDSDGNVVITRLDESYLRAIADEGNGQYISGARTEAAVEELTAALEKIDRTEFEAKQFAAYKDQFQWFIGLGLLFLFLDIFLLERKTAWIRNLNLFNEKEND